MPTVSSFNRNLVLMTGFSIIAVILNHKISMVYIPPMFILAFSFIGGVLEPRKGWILALIQIGIIIGGYWLNRQVNFLIPSNSEVAFFATHTSPLATLSASFMGALIKKM